MSEDVKVLGGPLAVMRDSVITLLTEAAESLAELGEETASDRQRLKEVGRDLREMFFLVVVIGEFNAGKSTFINALLGAEVLPTGITPTTEMIELIRYNETPDLKPRVEEGGLRVWAHPNTGAKGVAIVDTPGTGSVFQQHEKIAKDFLHRSDLVIFVLSAKRAFAETERLYMEMAKNFGKKVILVVNQMDLLGAEEQKTVRRFIEQQVKETLGLQPLLFLTSAKQARDSQRAGAVEEAGGVDAVRGHLRGVLAEAPPAKQKLLAQLETGAKIIERYDRELAQKADLVRADTAKVREVEDELKQQSLGLDAQLTNARAEVDTVFEAMRQRGLAFIDANLSVRLLGRSINKDKLQADFQDVVIGRATRDINDATNGYINAVVDQSRLYWRSVINRLNKLIELLQQEEITGLDANVYAEQRENLEEAVRIAEAELKSYSSGRLVQEIEREFSVNMSGFTTSMLAAIGGLLVSLAALAAPGAIFGVGGAASAVVVSAAFAVAAPVAAVGGIAALRYYRRLTTNLKRDFNERLDKLRMAYHTALDDLTQRERRRLANYGQQVLTPIFSRLEVLAKRYEEQKKLFDGYRERAKQLEEGIRES